LGKEVLVKRRGEERFGVIDREEGKVVGREW
jgi:hypothetical protein